jgi:hypothetical protein
MNPVALIKLAALIMPLCGDEVFGRQMLAEITYLFNAIERIDLYCQNAADRSGVAYLSLPKPIDEHFNGG